jgi:hypothetical protein
MNLKDQIRDLDDKAAPKCLAIVKKGLEEDPEYGPAIVSPDEAGRVLAQMGAKADELSKLPDADPELAREILLMMADDDQLRPRVESAVGEQRSTLFEPVTTALIMTGIVIALSTHITISYEDRDGKKYVSVVVEKKTSDKGIIKKILSVLH